MRFKKVILIMLLLLTVLTISSVSAIDDNGTEDIINIDNDQIDVVGLDENSGEIASNEENDEAVCIDEEYSKIGQNNEDTSISTSQNAEVLSDDYVNLFKLTINSVTVYSHKSFTYSVKFTDNGNPVSGETVYLYVKSKYNQEYYDITTDSNGIAKFYLRLDDNGKHYVSASNFYCDDVSSWIYVIQNPKTKTTVKAPVITAKYKQNKYFTIKVKNYKRKPVKGFKLLLKIKTGKKWKTYYIKTNKKGVAKFNTKKLKKGTHKVQILNYIGDKYDIDKKSKIIIKNAAITNTKKKSKHPSVTLKLKVDSTYYSQKKLKTGDVLLAVANSYYRQQGKGITIGTMIDAGQEGQHSTKLIKAKVWFKNDYTGKIKIKTQGPNKKGNNIKRIPWIEGYTPYKAKVWYKHR